MDTPLPYLFGYVATLQDGVGLDVKHLSLAALDGIEVAAGERMSRADDGDSALFAQDGERIIALAVLRPWPEYNSLFLGMAWTHPDYRKQGIYRHLFEQAKQLARGRGCRALELGVDVRNETSQRVHLALGAKPTAFEVVL